MHILLIGKLSADTNFGIASFLIAVCILQGCCATRRPAKIKMKQALETWLLDSG